MRASLDAYLDGASTLRCEFGDGVFRIWLSAQPISFETLGELVGLARCLHQATQVRVVVLASDGSDFCHGMDLRDPELSASIGKDQGHHISILGGELIHSWSHLPMPTLCILSGRAIGAGACLVWASDFRVASRDAQIWFPEIDRGMHLAWGIVPRLVRELGPHWARRLALLGERVSVECFPDGHFFLVSDAIEDQALDVISRLSSKPTTAAKSIKKMILADGSNSNILDQDAAHFVASIRDPEFMLRVRQWIGLTE